MGGHTQFGELNSLSEAVKLWHDYMECYVAELHLFLSYGHITYDVSHNKFKLFMRFTK